MSPAGEHLALPAQRPDDHDQAIPLPRFKWLSGHGHRTRRAWQEAAGAYTAAPDDRRVERAEPDAFWDWALLELLVQSGLRVEEAGDLTTSRSTCSEQSS